MSSIITKIAVVITMVLTVVSLYFWNANKQLNEQVSDKTANIKSLQYGMVSYKDQLGKYHSNSIEQNTTIAQLEYAKDSTTQALIKLTKEYKINLKSVVADAIVKTALNADTVIKIKSVSKDTTYDLSSRPYIIETIRLTGDSLKRDLEIYNKQNLVWYTKRETIDPPKKFFLLRWFQKKQNVTYVDIINDNPFIKTTNQQFQVITK